MTIALNYSYDSRVNAVEVMYASFPFFLTMNATYGKYLLRPVLEWASSSYWTYDYAPRDIGKIVYYMGSTFQVRGRMGLTCCYLGASYPNATGNFVAHTERVERKT